MRCAKRHHTPFVMDLKKKLINKPNEQRKKLGGREKQTIKSASTPTERLRERESERERSEALS